MVLLKTSSLVACLTLATLPPLSHTYEYETKVECSNDFCYLRVKDRKTWCDANRWCEEKYGGYLAEDKSQKEHEVLTKLVEYGDRIWIGGCISSICSCTGGDGTGDWIWSHSTGIQIHTRDGNVWRRWQFDEPTGGSQQCVQIWSAKYYNNEEGNTAYNQQEGYVWVDEECNDGAQFLCQRAHPCIKVDCHSGSCDVDQNGDAECTCEAGWYGAYCDEYPPRLAVAGLDLATNVIIWTEGNINAKLICDISANPEPSDANWFKEGEQGWTLLGSTTSDNSLIHPVPNVKRELKGVYKCEVGNNHGINRISFSLEVLYADLTVLTNELIVKEFDVNVTLHCEISTNLAYTLKWSKNGGDASKHVVTEENGKSSLRISEVTRFDAGTYVCTANSENNAIGTLDKMINLVVIYPCMEVGGGVYGPCGGGASCVNGTCDYCSPNQCKNGLCISKPTIIKNKTSNYTCKCNEGYSGPTCKLDDNPCLNDPEASCKNGGKCEVRIQPGDNDWICQCPGGPRLGQAKDCSENADTKYSIPEAKLLTVVSIPLILFGIVWVGCCVCECITMGEAPDLEDLELVSLSSVTTDSPSEAPMECDIPREHPDHPALNDEAVDNSTEKGKAEGKSKDIDKKTNTSQDPNATSAKSSTKGDPQTDSASSLNTFYSFKSFESV